MIGIDLVTAAVNPYVTAVIGLAGTAIGGAIAGGISLRLAKQGREAAADAWLRETRHETYDRFLTAGQEYLVTCEKCRSSGRPPNATATVEEAHSTFFEAYSVVQFVAGRPVVDAARVYGYRLLQLRFETIGGGASLGPQGFGDVSRLVRFARHDVVDAIRRELGMHDSARPPDDFSAFDGTHLAKQYREVRDRGETDRPSDGR